MACAEGIRQKQENILALHTAFQAQVPGKSALEISTESMKKEGVLLSVFKLCLDGVEVEKFYQSIKVFEYGGPFDLRLASSSKAAKMDSRLTANGKLLGFSYEGRVHKVGTTFFHWLYLKELLQHPELAESLLAYDGFTDIEYGPKGLNC